MALESANSALQLRMIGVLPRVVMARMRGMLFDTNKCFLLPTAIEALRRIRENYGGQQSERSPGGGSHGHDGRARRQRSAFLERAKSVRRTSRTTSEVWLQNYDLPGKRKWARAKIVSLIISMPDFALAAGERRSGRVVSEKPRSHGGRHCWAEDAQR